MRKLLFAGVFIGLCACGPDIPKSNMTLDNIVKIFQIDSTGHQFSVWVSNENLNFAENHNVACNNVKLFLDVPSSKTNFILFYNGDSDYYFDIEYKYNNCDIHIHTSDELNPGEHLGKYPLHLKNLE